MVAAAATLFLSVVFFLGPLTDDDLSLHLGMGHWLDMAGYPFSDVRFQLSPFEVTGWQPHEWLFSLGLWKIYEQTGTCGLIVFRFLGWGLLLALLVHAFSPSRRGALYFVALVTGLLAGAPLWTIRPHLVMLLGIVFTVLVARRPDPGRWRFTGLAVFYLVWANCHASVVIGLGVWFLFRWPNRRLSPGRELMWLAILPLVTLLNPAGRQLWFLPIKFLGESKGTFVAEWGSLRTLGPSYAAVEFALFTLMVAVAFLRIRHARPYPWCELVLWAGLTLWAVAARRMVAPAIVAGLIAIGTRARWDWFWQRTTGKSVRDLVIVLFIGVLIVGSWWYPVGKRPFPNPALAASLELVVTSGPPWPPRVFHPYEWGGWLLLAGQNSFIDGRTEAFTLEHLASYGTLYYCGPRWQELLNRKYDIDGWRVPYLITGIWLPPDAPLARAVANDPGWMLQYSSPAAVYYLRR